MADILQMKKKHLLKFIFMLVGAGGVGKSSIIIRYTQNKFDTNIQSTTGIDFLQKKVSLNNKTIKQQIWDTSGQQIYKAVAKSRLKRANAIIFVYDLTRQKSLSQMIEFWIPNATQQCPKGTIYAVFGNKSDLVKNEEQLESIKSKLQIKLQFLANQYQISIMNFIGNCKQENNPGINEMMMKLTQKLYQKSVEQQAKALEQSRIQKQRQSLKMFERKSIILTNQNNKSSKQKKKQKRCFF